MRKTARVGTRLAFLLLLSLLYVTAGRADGPHIAFHGTSGPYEVTLFSAPDPLVNGPVQLVLLVQRSADGSLVRGVAAMGRLQLAKRPGVPLVFRLGEGANPQLPGASVTLPVPGNWTLLLHLTGSASAQTELTVVLPVAANHGKRNTVLRAVALLAAAIVLFLANQYGKQKLRARHV